MAQLTRVQQKIFGSTGATTQFAQIGSLAAGAALKTKDLATIQALGQYDSGLYAITNSASEPPRIQDINSLYFLATTQLEYMFQTGIPEWETNTEYYQNVGYVQKAGVIYRSIKASVNQGTDPASDGGVNWGPAMFGEGLLVGTTVRTPGISTKSVGENIGLYVANTDTDATTKNGIVACGHYTTGEEPLILINGRSESVENYVRYGGGSGVGNAATIHEWYAAANNVTLAGTKVMELVSGDLSLLTGGVNITGTNELNLGYDQGGGAVLKYNANGNLDITPRSGFNTVFTAGNVLINSASNVATLHVEGTARVTGAVGYVGFAATGNQIDFSRNNANYINCNTVGGFLAMNTNGRTGTATANLILNSDISVTVNTSLLVDTISEKTGAAGVTIDGLLIKDSGIGASFAVQGSLTATTSVLTNTINERTSGAGVTIDSVLLKDNTVTAATLTANTSVITDTINEKTAGAGIGFDNILTPTKGVKAGGESFSASGTFGQLFTFLNTFIPSDTDFLRCNGFITKPAGAETEVFFPTKATRISSTVIRLTIGLLVYSSGGLVTAAGSTTKDITSGEGTSGTWTFVV